MGQNCKNLFLLCCSMYWNELYYILLWIFGIFFFVRIMQKPELIYSYPYMMSFGFVVFILPQVFVIYEKKPFAFDSANRLFLMTIVCWIMCFIGWYAFKPKSFSFKNSFLKNHNEKTLGNVAIVFVLVGMLFNFLANKMFAESEFENQQATGIITIFVFFQQLVFIGTGLCLALSLKTKKTLITIFAVIGILYGFYIGVLQGKRTQTLNTLFVLGIPLYIMRGIKPSRIIVISFLVVAFFILPSMEQYRKILKTSDNTSQFLQRLTKEMDFGKNLRDFYIKSESIELINAGYQIDEVYRSGEYMLGFDYWNKMVFRFVPAQIVGKDFKKSLMLERSLLTKNYRLHYKPYNPNYMVGTTATGMGDSFQQFDYFGSLFFLLVGMFMRKVWVTIKETENYFLQTFYSISIIDSGIITLTHGTLWFFPNLLSTFVFLMIASLISRKE